MLKRPLLAGGLVVALFALSSCGFDDATDRPYTPGVGTEDVSGQVSVLAAVIVAAQPNEGTLVATLVSKSADEELSLVGAASPDLTFEEFEPFTVEPRDHLNLGLVGGPTLTGDFDAGDVIPVTLTFSDGDDATLNFVVVRACGPYEGLDQTEDSTNVPYDCDAEHQDGHGDEAEGE